jgi:endoglucanase
MRLSFCLLLVLSNNCISQYRMNQLGFYPTAPKIAILAGNPTSDRFYLLQANTRDTVYSATMGKPMESLYASGTTRRADFSKWQKPGIYILYVKGAGESQPLTISNSAQHAVALSSLKAFYYQRVSMPLEEKYAGRWARAAGHPDTAVLIHASAASPQRPAGTVINSTGGWYDAGDYNKYIVNSGITMGTLLSAYEDFSKYFDTLKTNIPESSDRVPDVLNEILYNLRWMLTMQDPNDGGVYNKCTNANFDGMVMPGVTKLPRYVVQKGTAATLDFAAVTAQAARIYKRFNKQLSDSCLTAAQKAWLWAKQNPAMAYDQDAINKKFEPAITTGGYGDHHFTDEWFWAASELFVTTGNQQYWPTIQQYIPTRLSVPSWPNVHLLGCYSLLRSKVKPMRQQLQQQLLAFADSLSHRGDMAYSTVMGQGKNDFIWGSNSVALNQSIVLINAYLVSGDRKYLPYALHNLDYVMGRNATGFCYVTGIGYKSTMHPHHRPSVADGIVEPVPGMLAGGANPGRQDKCEGYPSTLPAECYLDQDCSYASNEIAINWNAPLVYVANALEVLLNK